MSEQFFPMNADFCSVEDMNIQHIKECLLMFCVASFEDWFCAGAGFVHRPHLLLGGAHSVATCPQGSSSA